METYNVGDKVYVVNWNKQYSNFTKWENGKKVKIFNWQSEISDYPGSEFHWKFVFEPNLTLKGTVNKREPKKLKEKIPIFKDYKYEILEIIKHPDRDELIYLLASTHSDKLWEKCFVQISADGISKLTPEQYLDDKFNALKEAHRGKWTIGMRERAQKEFPKELLGVIYDIDDRVLFGSTYIRGKVQYNYIPAEYMVTGNNFFIYTTISYDGEGNLNLPDGAILMEFKDLLKVFPDNK